MSVLQYENILYDEESYHIQGAVFAVYKEMGSGFLEAVYQECLEREFSLRSIIYETQKELVLCYKGKQLEQKYVPDFICYNKIIVEIKAAREINTTHKAQLLNYLKATSLRLGLLVNFGAHSKAQIIRIAN